VKLWKMKKGKTSTEERSRAWTKENEKEAIKVQIRMTNAFVKAKK